MSITALFLFSACAQVEVEDLDYSIQSEAMAHFVLTSVSLSGIDDLSFDVLIERPDLGLSQFDYDGLYSNDLPDSLNPKLMYVSSLEDTEPQSGRMCHRPVFPHECQIDLAEDHGDSETFLLKVLFEDGSYASQEVDVPIPEQLEVPEVLRPSKVPEDNSPFYMQFENVGADKYEAKVYLCTEYQNDGINPCLNSDSYEIRQESGKWVMNEFDTFYNPIFEVSDGFVEIGSEFFVSMDESLEYEVIATKNSLLTSEDGLEIPAQVKVWSYVVFD